MPSHIEQISFDRGLNTRRSPLVLEDGELVTAQGLSYNTAGELTPRSSKQAVSTVSIGVINGMHRNLNNLFVTDAGTARWKWDLDGFCDQYVPPNENFTSLGSLYSTSRPVFCDHEQFSFFVTGKDKKVFLDGHIYEWDIAAPTNAPIGAAGAAGNPSGTYYLYYTYLIYFPNGFAVETAPSPAGSVTVSSQAISWSNILPCPYSGTGLTIYRKLYRYSTTLIETYLVTTIGDNTTTTYTDDYTDAQLEVNAVIGTSDYVIPPNNPSYAVSYLQRVFCVKDEYLYPSVAYKPFNFDSTEAIQVTQSGDNIVAANVWGDQLYIVTASRWYRLHGTSSTSWTIKNTFASAGIINKHTVQVTRHGILGLWYDGIYLFDGSISKNITAAKLNKSFFDGIATESACYAEWDGRKYYFHYPTSGTTISKRLILDFIQYPDILIYHDDFVPTAHEYHEITGINYYGYNGYHYAEGGTDTCSLSIKTGDRACKNVLFQKQLEYLYYDCNTNSKDLVVSIYMDDNLVFTKTINNSTRTKERVLLPTKQGYRFYVTITAADARGMTIYEPWAISVNVTGM